MIVKHFNLLIVLSFVFQFSASQNREDFRTNQRDTFYGKDVTDPYRSLEDTGNLKVKAWMKAETKKSKAFFANFIGRQNLYNEIKTAMVSSKSEDVGTIRFWKGKYYVSKRYIGQDNFSLYEIDKKGNEKLFIDPQKIHPEIKSKNVMLAGFKFHDDNPYLLYALIAGGNETDPKDIMRNMETGKEYFDTLYLRTDMSITSFDPHRADAFYYMRFPFYKKAGITPLHWSDSSTIHYHIIGTDPGTDRTIIGMDTSLIKREFNDYVDLVIEKDLPFVYAIVKNKVANQYRIYAVAKDEFNGTETKWKKITDFDDKVSSYDCYGDHLYLLTQKDASNSKVVRVDVRNGSLQNATVLVPNSKKLIKDIWVTKTGLLVTATDAGQGVLMRIPHGTNTTEVIQTPLKGNIKVEWADSKENAFIISIVSYVKFLEYFTYNPETKKLEHSVVQKYYSRESAPLEIKDVLVKSHDGIMVPMTIIYKKGLSLDGTHPVTLSGYGAYGYTDDPYFWPENTVWFHHGGITAIAHVRGGGIYGEEWKVAGQKATKPNTWKDFIACAEYLIANKYATNKNLIGRGGSAGGITIGRAITERPDLFGAAFIDVGALDMIRMETSPNGKGNIPEFGSVATKEGFDALYEMSSYHHVKDGEKYPTIILSHGVNDTRVPLWMSLKMAARLQDATTSGNPILLNLNFDTGHGFQETMSEIISRSADRYAFEFWKAGLAGYKPGSNKTAK